MKVVVSHNWEYFLEFAVIVMLLLIFIMRGLSNFLYLGISEENETAFVHTIVPLI